MTMGDYQTDQRMAAKLSAIPLPDLKGVSVLDVGTDHGAWVRLALERGASRVLGLDRGRHVRGEGWVDLVERNRASIPGAEFERIDWGNEFTEFGRFDVVLCLSMYHHAYGNCGDHDRLWSWLRAHTGKVLLWEGPLDTRDSVARRATEGRTGYDRDSIISAAERYFEVEVIGPAVHEPYREVLRCIPR